MMPPLELDLLDAEAPGAIVPAGLDVGPDAPLHERLRFGSPMHGELLDVLKKRRDYSKDAMESRHEQWNETRENMRLFVDLERGAKLGDFTRDPQYDEMPFKRSIAVPLQYAIMHVILTQIMSIFASREPMFPLKGRGPEDYFSAQIMEALLYYDQMNNKGFSWLYSHIQDALTYGCGVSFDSWERDQGMITEYQPLQIPGIPPQMTMQVASMLGIPPVVPIEKWGVRREYSHVAPISPFNYYPDPNVPLHDVQSGISAGHMFTIGYPHLKSKEMPRGPYFNLEFLPTHSRRDRIHEDKTETQMELQHGYRDPGDRGAFELEHMQWLIIPSEFPTPHNPIGTSTNPEKWWFTWAEDVVIVRAHKAPVEHRKFTYAVSETDSDFHETFSPGLIENLDGIQRAFNTHFNGYIESLQRFLNHQFVYHPRFIEQADLEYGGPGEHIRMTDEAVELLLTGQASSIEQFFHQVPVTDVIGPSFSNVAQFLHSWAQQATAANAPMSGMPTQTRRTATEIGTIVAKASDRISILTRLIDTISIQPLVMRLIANRQQFTEMEDYVRITGDLARRIGFEQIVYSKDNITGQFDYIPTSGIVPEDPARQAMVWANLIGMGSQNPMLMQPGPDGRMLDFRELFNEAARRSGIRNIDQFYFTVQPQEQIQQGAQAGNMVPM